MKKPGLPVQNIFTFELGFSFDKAIPESAAAIEAKIDRDEASDDLTKEKLHSTPVIKRCFDDQAAIGLVKYDLLVSP